MLWVVKKTGPVILSIVLLKSMPFANQSLLNTLDCAPMVEVGVTFEERHDFLQLHLLAITFLAAWTIFAAVEAHLFVKSVLPRRPDHLLKHTHTELILDKIP